MYVIRPAVQSEAVFESAQHILRRCHGSTTPLKAFAPHLYLLPLHCAAYVQPAKGASRPLRRTLYFHYHAVPAAHYAYAYGCAGQHMLRHSDIGPFGAVAYFGHPLHIRKGYPAPVLSIYRTPGKLYHIHRVAPGHAALRAKLSCGIIHIVSQPFRRAPGNGQHAFEGQRLKE